MSRNTIAVSPKTASQRQPVPQVGVIAAGLLLLALVTGAAAVSSGWRLALLTVIGFSAGVALYHASFGFASAWRILLVERRSVRVRVQLILFALTMIVFFPLLSQGSAFGRSLYGFVNQVGIALCVGAFLFGIVAVVSIQFLFVGSAFPWLPCSAFADVTGALLIGLAPLMLAYLIVAALASLMASAPEK